MVFIGLGVFTISVIGQIRPKVGYGLFSSPAVLGGFAKVIENEIESVSRVSNISINEFYEKDMEEPVTTINFTVTTTDGDVFENFQCHLLVNKKKTLVTVGLVKCGNTVAKFKKKILIPMQTVFGFYENDGRRDLE